LKPKPLTISEFLSAAMVEKAKSGHPGGAMGGADFIHILYSEFLNYDPSDMSWANRDRFFLDPGHMSPMLYSVLSLAGYYSMEDLSNFRQWGSVTPGHPERMLNGAWKTLPVRLDRATPWQLELPLPPNFWQPVLATGCRIKFTRLFPMAESRKKFRRVQAALPDTSGLENLIMFYDSNDIQLSTKTDAVTAEDTAKKYEAWGWNVVKSWK
jgi:transketolase